MKAAMMIATAARSNFRFIAVDDRVEAGEEVAGGQQVREDVGALVRGRAQRGLDHGASLQRAITSAPPRTRSPTRTAGAAAGGRKMSTREPKRISP